MAFKKLFKKKHKRACVVGLDGVPYSMLRSFMEAGVMPNTRDIAARGALNSMTVSLPEISSVSWTSFMTGCNPGEHGIFGFTDLKPNTYDLSFPSFRDVKTDTIWDRLGQHGLKSIVINQPSTYPAREIPGVLISGFVAIDISRALYPRKYLASLARAHYQIDIDAGKCRDNPEQLFTDLSSSLAARQAIMDELWTKEPWNLMEIIITGTDRLQHFQWDAYESTDHPYHERFLNYYREVDAFIGHVYDRYTNETDEVNFFMLSDHGFCQIKHEVYVNSILEQNGFLAFESGHDGELGAITSSSKAFALDPARVYIHRKGRYPKGNVEDSEIAAIKQELTALFESIKHDGQPIIRRVFDGADVYSGPVADKGPDLLLIPKNGYDLKGRIGSKEIVGERRLQGMHTWDDAFFFSHDAAQTIENDLTIFDVPGKITRSLDVEL